MNNDELRDQYERCEQWNDPIQWEILAVEYYKRGYELNALRCFRNADACRVPDMSQEEREFITTWWV